MFSWRSEDRISSREEQWVANHFPINGNQDSRNSVMEDDRRSQASSRHVYDDDQGSSRLHRGTSLQGRSGQSTDDSVNGHHGYHQQHQQHQQLNNNQPRAKVTSSSDDYVDKQQHERRGSLPRSVSRAPRRFDHEDIEPRNDRRKSSSGKSGRLSSYEDSDGVNHGAGIPR
jgi:hypothetical protein